MNSWIRTDAGLSVGRWRISKSSSSLTFGGIFVLISICLAAAFLNPTYGSITTKPIAEGVTLTEEIDQDPPQIIHVLTVDVNDPNIHLEPIPGQDTVTGPTGDIHEGREEVREIAVRHGAVAGVNGDFFPFTGDPLGAAVWNGDLYSEPYPDRCVMGIEPDGHTLLFGTVGFLGEVQTIQNQLFAISGVDRMVSATDTSDLVVFTPTFGPKSGIRPGCVEVILTGVNLPLKPSKLLTGTVASVSLNSQAGSSIPSNGVILSALPKGDAAAFLTTNLHIGDRAEFVCSIAPQAVLASAVKLAMVSRDANDLPVETAESADPVAYNWATVKEVIGGGPRLLDDGQVAVDGFDEGFTDSFVNDPNPRTGVGVTSDGKLLIITVDGRQSMSKGVSLSQFAEIFKRFGAVNAMNLDGGGSTTMVADGMVINSIASTGVERPVANSLCVFAPALNSAMTSVQVSTATPTPIQTQTLSTSENSLPPISAAVVLNNHGPTPAIAANLSISGLPATLSVGQTVRLNVNDKNNTVIGSDSTVIWQGSVDSGIAFVDQTGLLTALHGGQGTIVANYKGQIVRQSVTILDGPLEQARNLINASINVPDATSPRQTVLLLGVFDHYGMPIASSRLHLDVSGGTASQYDLQTDVDGGAQTNIVWKRNSGGSVTIESSGLVPKTLTQP